MTDFLTVTMNPAVDLSAVVDHVEHTHKIRCGTSRLHPGGGGINVSRVIQRLGGDARALFPVGGHNGNLLRQMLEKEGVPSYCYEVAGETRQNFSVHESLTGNDFRFVLPGADLTPSESNAILSRIAEIKSPCRYLVASGSLPGGVPLDFYAKLSKLAKHKGCLMVLDTSGDALKFALEEGVFMIKPSLNELRELTGSALNTNALMLQAARQLISRGQVQIVALSLGEQGALVVTANEAFFARALLVNVASTVGAGDSFLGGFLWAFNLHKDIELALRYGVAAGTAALLAEGTALCKAENVARFHHNVLIDRLGAE
jgi:6-phosphofructokinase 2